MTQPDDRPTADQALANAARLLAAAEMETNLPVAACLDGIADSWIRMAELLTERERV